MSPEKCHDIVEDDQKIILSNELIHTDLLSLSFSFLFLHFVNQLFLKLVDSKVRPKTFCISV